MDEVTTYDMVLMVAHNLVVNLLEGSTTEDTEYYQYDGVMTNFEFPMFSYHGETVEFCNNR